MENYIVINGKKAELTEAQLKQLGIKVKKISPFERASKEEPYFYISCNGDVSTGKDCRHDIDKKVSDVANYCTDRELIEQRALHETLNRLLWRFACENGELENEWNGENYHFEVFFDEDKQEFKAQYRVVTHTFGPFFRTKGDADKAIEIIKEFIEAHPDFIW